MDNIDSTTLTEINALGQPCPMPLLLLKRHLKNSLPEQTFLLKSSDPHSEIDVLRYCQIHHLDCQLTRSSNQEFHYLIKS